MRGMFILSGLKLFQDLPRPESGIYDNQVQSKSKIPDFERERIEVGNRSNPDKIGISRIGRLDPTRRLGLRRGFEIASERIST